MKKHHLLLIVLLCLNLVSKAQNRTSSMQLRLRDNNLLTIIIDDRQYNKFGYSLTIGDLPPGMHDLKVYRFYPVDEQDNSRNRRKKAEAVLAFKGRIRLSPATMYYCTIDALNKTMSIRESRTLATSRGEKSYDFDGDYAITAPQEDPYDIYGEEEKVSPQKQEQRPRSGMMNDEAFYTLENAVAERSGDEAKYKLISAYLEGKQVSTEQVMDMMGWLQFEATKLRLAKHCFPLVQNPDKYLKVSSALKFQSSKSELENLIFAKKDQKYLASGQQKAKPTESKTAVAPDNKLTTSDLNLIHKNLEEKITDTEKKKIAQQYLSERKYTSSQVATMLDWFTFEGTKLEFAQWCFPKVTDAQNYEQLKAKLNFSSSKKTIDDLMQGRTKK